MFYTIATAGHIDHGKSTVVKALTGINPDRLPEELEREMTIDLGFAWFSLDDNSEVGIVDVPGHERFIRNMIAGVGGIDYVLFIVAADDGWMPQSQEHLEILNFLDHKHGAIILTKTDLVKKDWVELVCDDIMSRTEGTFLENAPILKFSAQGNVGIEDIVKHLTEALPKLPDRYNPRKPRLFIDRVFSMTGIGTVVTGTMREGEFSTGDEVMIVPTGRTAKIKSIQSFKLQREQAFQGARAALSLTGIGKEDISRGDCLIRPSTWSGTRDIALRVHLSPSIRIPLSHNRKVTVLIGTTEIEAKVRLFREEKIPQDSEGVCLLNMEQKVMARLGDRVILRYPTPDVLVGGGIVTDVDLTGFIRRDKDMRKFYFERETGDVNELLMTELRKYKTRIHDELLQASGFSVDDIEAALKDLIDDGKVEKFGNSLINSEYKAGLIEKVAQYLKSFHENNPVREGISKSELVSRLKIDQTSVEFAVGHLQELGQIELKNKLLHLKGHKSRLNPQQEKTKENILDQLAVLDLQTPTRREVEKKLHVVREVLNFMIQSGEVIELTEGILYSAEDFHKITDAVVGHIKSNGSVIVKDVKDLLGLTRKYTIPILERLDQNGVTRRDGDKRILND
jgi:selenocysteine-specific elongation factor